MAGSWREILDQIERLHSEAKREGRSTWYRGQRLARWPIQSSVHRRVDQDLNAVGKALPEAERIALMRDVYKSLYHKFKARAWHLLDSQQRSDWGIIFSMQHHGIPTRLIDWTESLVCALYFAQRGRDRSDDAAIFLLDPVKLNRRTIGREALVALGGSTAAASLPNVSSYHPGFVCCGDDAEAIAVAPVLSNPRMVAQRCAFMMSGASFEPLEKRYPDCITKIPLPEETFKDARRFLNIVGSGHFGYFPDLEGLKQELAEAMDREVEEARDSADGNSV